MSNSIFSNDDTPSNRLTYNYSRDGWECEQKTEYKPNPKKAASDISEKPKVFDDPINHPNHYQSGTGLEVINVIESFTEDLNGFEGACTGNVIKYICRWKHKNGIEDLKKARWYLNTLIDYVETED